MESDRYYCKCPTCEHEFLAAKSILHTWGMLDAGSGRCQKCNTLHNLTLDEPNKRMIVTPWEKYKEQNMSN